MCSPPRLGSKGIRFMQARMNRNTRSRATKRITLRCIRARRSPGSEGEKLMQKSCKVHEDTTKLRPPTADVIRAAAGCRIPDLIAPDLRVLFCGINPGLYSAATKRHFARPGNRFWQALHLAGFTPRVLAPDESHDLLELGYGITSLVRRATATAREVAAEELVAGRRRLARTMRIHRPR